MTDHPHFQLTNGAFEALIADRSWPVPDFWEFNFAYGMNGSGKTSLARAIVNGATNSGLMVKHFDRDYVYQTLAPTDIVEGLWVVSPEAASLVKERDALTREEKELREQLSRADAELGQAQEHYAGLLRGLSEKLRPLKRKARGSDASSYSPTQVEAALRTQKPPDEGHSRETREAWRRTIEQEPLGTIRGFGITEGLRVLELLTDARTPEDIEDIAGGHTRSWTAHEPAVTRAVEGRPCPFCDQPLTSQAVRTIRERSSAKGHRGSEAFQRFGAALDRLRDGIIHEWPDPDEFHQALRARATKVLEESKRRQSELTRTVPSVDQAIDDIGRLRNGPDLAAWLQAARALRQQLEKLRDLISEHESARDSQDSDRLQAFDAYETSLIADTLEEWKRAQKRRDEKSMEKTRVRTELDRVKADLEQVGTRLRGLMPPDVLNEDLRRYLGHDAIRFAAHPGDGSSDPGYQVIRSDGRRAERLSEGELTAVALLYFLRGCRTTEATAPPDVVVIDDPVTSLDDAGVFSAHAFIKDALARDHGADGPTVFVLTHNHAYFRLLAEWAWTLNRNDRREEDRRDRARLLETIAFVDDAVTTCRLRLMSDAIAGAGTEYAILMARLVEYRDEILAPSGNTDVPPLELQVAPNVARRVLEGFLAFKFGASRRDMIGNLLDRALRDGRLDEFAGERRERLNKLLNASSHGTHLVDSYQVVASRTEIRNVISDVLDLIATVDPDHYKGFIGE